MGLAIAKTIAPSAIDAMASRLTAPGPERPMKTSAPASASASRAAEPVGVGSPGILGLPWAEVGAIHVQRALAVEADDRADAEREQHVGRRDPSGPDAGEHDADLLRLLADDPERVEQRRGDHDRGAVLVVVEDRDVEACLQPPLDLEAARRRDVLEVDPAEAGRDRAHRGDDLVRVGRREADRPGIDAAELLEQHRLALHHRHRRLGPDVAQPEHGRPVADHRHGVLLDREVPDLAHVLGDRHADARHARRVGHREVVARLERRLRDHLDLPAEVEQERAVGDVLDLDPDERLHGGDDLLQVVGARGIDRDVAHLLALLDPDEIDRAEAAPRVADGPGDVGKGPGAVLEVNAQGRAERRRRVRLGHGLMVADRGPGAGPHNPSG